MALLTVLEERTSAGQNGRVSFELIDPGIVLLKTQLISKSDHLYVRTAEVTKEILLKHRTTRVIVDVEDSVRFSAPNMPAVNRALAIVEPHLDHIAFVYGKNLMVRIASRFVMHTCPIPSSFHKDRALALEYLRKTIP